MPPQADACADACVEVATEAGIASCHACRCKVAFDDWLPSVDDMQCRNAEPIVTYHAVVTNAGYELEPSGPSAIRCANPSLLNGSCRPGSKRGQLQHGDVKVEWICRDPYLAVDGVVTYEDVAVIGHNARSGATCFWDDVNDVLHDDDLPPFDLSEATVEDRGRFVELFAFTDGSGCVLCHDHDPFIYTPYLQSTQWDSFAADKGPYSQVGLDEAPRATGTMHLVSNAADPCTRCHRIGNEGTCTTLAPDSVGLTKGSAYEPEVHAAARPGDPNWTLAYWMPGATAPAATWPDWQARFGEARDHIQRCCGSLGIDVGDCVWAPVPTQ